MRRITGKEVEEFLLKKKKRQLQAMNAGVLKVLDELNVGDGLEIKKEDWKTKTPPSGYIHQTFRKTRSLKVFSVHILFNDEGWVVIRKK